MPYIKGESGNPAGRPKGSKNRSTTAIREMLSFLIEENLDNMSDWLRQIGQDDPKAAFQCMLGLMEFNIPKMSRVSYVEPRDETPTQDDDIDAFLEATLAAIQKYGP